MKYDLPPIIILYCFSQCPDLSVQSHIHYYLYVFNSNGLWNSVNRNDGNKKNRNPVSQSENLIRCDIICIVNTNKIELIWILSFSRSLSIGESGDFLSTFGHLSMVSRSLRYSTEWPAACSWTTCATWWKLIMSPVHISIYSIDMFVFCFDSENSQRQRMDKFGWVSSG